MDNRWKFMKSKKTGRYILYHPRYDIKIADTREEAMELRKELNSLGKVAVYTEGVKDE